MTASERADLAAEAAAVLGGGPSWPVLAAAHRYAEAVRQADPDVSEAVVSEAVALAVLGAADDVLADVREGRDVAVAATFPAVSAYVSAAVGLPVVVGWSDTQDVDGAGDDDVLGVSAVVDDDGPAGDAFAWADASEDAWPDVLAARLRDDVAAWT